MIALFWGHRCPPHWSTGSGPGAGQPARRGRARADREMIAELVARRYARPAAGAPAASTGRRRLPVLEADRRSAGGAGRGPVVGRALPTGPRRSPARGTRREPRGRRVPGHAADVGGGVRAHRRRCARWGAGAAPSGISTVRRPHARRGRDAAAPRRPGRRTSPRSNCCSRRRRPDATRRAVRRHARRTGRSTAGNGRRRSCWRNGGDERRPSGVSPDHVDLADRLRLIPRALGAAGDRERLAGAERLRLAVGRAQDRGCPRAARRPRPRGRTGCARRAARPTRRRQ